MTSPSQPSDETHTLDRRIEAADSSAARRHAPYHHGNLPAALVQAAGALIEQDGCGALTLRAVARRVGVTHAAPYRHFKDKQALLHAVAHDARTQLIHTLRQAAAEPALRAPEAIGLAYLRYAHEHTAMFRLMFDEPAQQDDAATVASCFAEALRGATSQGATTARAAADVSVLWALWHGIATLELTGALASPKAAIDAAIESSRALVRRAPNAQPTQAHPEPTDVGDPR